jgi:predicted nucleic acid-binding protein
MIEVEIGKETPKDFSDFVVTRQALFKSLQDKNAFDKKVLGFNNRELKALDLIIDKINSEITKVPKQEKNVATVAPDPPVIKQGASPETKLRNLRLKAIENLGYKDMKAISDFNNDELLALEIFMLQLRNQLVKKGRKRTKVV